MSLHRIAQGLYVLAGQLDDLKAKYPQLSLDPLSKIKPKYYVWVVKQLLEGAAIGKVTQILEQFDKNQVRLKEKDINKYKDLSAVEQAFHGLGPSKSEIKATGSKKLYEDKNYLLLRLESKQACILYGAGTKWCITWKDQNHFTGYSMKGIKFYIWINKNILDYDHIQDVGDPLKKVAITVYPTDVEPTDGSYINIPGNRYLQLWDSSDTTVYPSSVPGLDLILPLILKDSLSAKSLKDHIQNNPEKLTNHPDANIREDVVKRIDPKYLPAMINDEDYSVRREVAKRIDPKYLPKMMKDSDSWVRITVAKRIDPAYLPEMLNDKESRVRMEVATRIEPKYLPNMMNDEDLEVRRVVASRIDSKYLLPMMDDISETVQYVVVNRIDPKYLPKLMNSDHWYIRLEVAKRIDPKYLPQMIGDDYYGVREEVVKRIDPKYLSQMANDKSPRVQEEIRKRLAE